MTDAQLYDLEIREVCRKPIPVQVVHASTENLSAIVGWIKGMGYAATLGEGQLTIQTLDGPFTVRPGDYVISEPNGGFARCDPEVYAATYDDPELEQ